jgi:signal transduction histidine kinase
MSQRKVAAAPKLTEISIAQSNPTENRRILIVDDEPEILKVYCDILTPVTNVIKLKSSRSITPDPLKSEISDHFIITKASTGEEAVVAVREACKNGLPFAGAFFDVLLGTGIDGIEAVRQIHEIDPEMYTIFVTAYQDRHVNSIQKIFGNEFQDRWDYLNKPFSEGEILQKARNLTSMWNMHRRNQENQEMIDSLQQRITENERHMTVAAVARGVGHEFGNILLQIMGRADLSRTSGEVEMRQALETILTASEHAAKVLNRFKNLSGPSEQLQKLEMLSVSDPIKDTLLIMDHELKRRSIKTLVSCDSLPPIVGSRTGLVQVFMNLTINAMHALEHSKGGTLEFKGSVKNENIEILIHDSGSGIAQENLNSIFETFFTTKGSKGSGLGLAICKEVIEITHAGKLTVKNHPQGGAEFCILIPITREGDES